jgi:hypothetical protein
LVVVAKPEEEFLVVAVVELLCSQAPLTTDQALLWLLEITPLQLVLVEQVVGIMLRAITVDQPPPLI